MPLQMQHVTLTETELDALFKAQAASSRMELAPLYGSYHYPSSPSASSTGSSSPTGSVTSSSSSTSTTTTITKDLVRQRCGYRTGKCQNLQAIKRNGTLHKLCEFHREKANQNQKKLDRKKRMQRFAPYDPHTSSSPVDDQSPRSAEDMVLPSFAPTPAPISLHEAPLAWRPEEVAIFCDLMDMHQRAAQYPSGPRLVPTMAQYHASHYDSMRVV